MTDLPGRSSEGARSLFVKICGVTTEEDALLAAAMGADAVGFVFAQSPRQVSPARAREIARRLPSEVVTVGVFRDESPERVIEIVHEAGLQGAQLHGSESPACSRMVAERVGFTIKAFGAGDDDVVNAREHPVDAILLDADVPGSGQVFDWALVEGIDPGTKVILAGGLNPANVADAIRAARPWGVDVSSGVESSPGRKDPRRVRSFIERARRSADALFLNDASCEADAPVSRSTPEERDAFVLKSKSGG
jgi:phosphoribosylanthranilate isomerase